MGLVEAEVLEGRGVGERPRRGEVEEEGKEETAERRVAGDGGRGEGRGGVEEGR